MMWDGEEERGRRDQSERRGREREGGHQSGKNTAAAGERGRGERRGERGIDGREDTTTDEEEEEERPHGHSLWDMVVTLPTFHEDRSWLKAQAS